MVNCEHLRALSKGERVYKYGNQTTMALEKSTKAKKSKKQRHENGDYLVYITHYIAVLILCFHF